MIRRRGTFWIKAAAVAGTIAVFGTAAGTVREWSPFAWSSDLIQVAQTTYATAIKQATSELVHVQFLLAQARAAGDQDAIRFFEARALELESDLAWLRQQQDAAGQ